MIDVKSSFYGSHDIRSAKVVSLDAGTLRIDIRKSYLTEVCEIVC